MKNIISSYIKYREKMLNDPYRPAYHFACPSGNGNPGDPNGAFFADGVYHLMYLYKHPETECFHWGHISSIDLLHWRHHQDALTEETGDGNCYSGGVFIDDDKTAYITYWKFPSASTKYDRGGAAIACAKPPYEKWQRLDTIAAESMEGKLGTFDIEIDRKTEHLPCADPSNIWKSNGMYYMQTGNKVILDLYKDDPYYSGDWTALLRSKDLMKWEFVHRFYNNPHTNPSWPDTTEDDMCPSLLPLYDAEENGNPTGKYLQLFISHNRGCQYYIGTLENETFIPEVHGRMSWNDLTFCAPEALVDNKNRQIMWAWLFDNIKNDFESYGWTGVFSFPRNLWLENDMLRMAPVKELEKLQYNKKIPEISQNSCFSLNNGEMFRLKAEFDVTDADKVGFSIKISPDEKFHTDIYYDKEKNLLVFDAKNSGIYGCCICEEAPLVLETDEKLYLDIFVDKSVVEVYANKKQAICRRVYPENPDLASGMKLIGEKSSLISIKAWDMALANPY